MTGDKSCVSVAVSLATCLRLALKSLRENRDILTALRAATGIEARAEIKKKRDFSARVEAFHAYRRIKQGSDRYKP